jgi:hypothetical protein
MNQNLFDPQTSQLLLGAMIATLVGLFIGAAVVWGLGSWFKSWLSGFDGLNAKREGGKLRFEGVLVDKARPPAPVRARRPAKRKAEPKGTNGATDTPLAFPREGRPS